MEFQVVAVFSSHIALIFHWGYGLGLYYDRVGYGYET